MKRTRWMAAATCVMVLLACTARLSADVLEQVPTNAMAVFKVNHLKTTSDKVAKLSQDLGLAMMEPRMADPLGFIQQQAQMTQGVNTAGDLAFVYLDPAAAGGDEDKSILILIPVTDYQAFLKNWPDAQTQGNVTTVQMGDSDDPGYLAQWGNYAALSPSEQVVASKPAQVGLKFPAATSKELAGKDAVLVANFQQLRAKLQPQLQQNREKLLADIEEGMAGTDDENAQKFAPVVRSIANQALNLVDRLLSDTEAATFGFSLTDEGIMTSLVGDFGPQTYIGQLMAQTKNNADSKLAGLPAGKYLFFGGSISDPESTAKVLDDMAQPILKEVMALGPEFKAAQTYYDGLRMYVVGSRSSTMGLMAPTGALGQESLIQGINIQRGEPQKMLEGYKLMMTSQQELMTALGVPAEQVKMTYTQGAKTVDGITFDAFKSDFQIDPDDPSAGQAQQFMNMLYGPEGATVMLGVVDNKMLVQAMGLRDEQLSKAVAAAKGGQAPLADLPGVKAVSANLPKENLGVFYVPVDEIVNTALNYARQFGVPAQIQLPPDLPPIGAAISTEGPAMRVDVYIPTHLVQSLVAAGMQAAMQMQGGPGGGGL